MNWQVAFSLLLPEPALWTLTALAAVLAAAGIVSRARGALLRALALAALLAALWGPTLLNEDRQPIGDIAVIVRDESQSQSFGDRRAETEEAARRLAEEAKAVPNLEIRTITARSGVTSGEDGTRLFEALRDALADVPPERFAGAVMITDGQVHDVPETKPPLPGYSGPIHALITGSKNEIDRRMIIVQAPRFGIVGQQQTIRFKVEDHGIAPSGPVDVTVSVDGQPAGTVAVTPGQTAETSVNVSHGGPNLIELQVGEAPGEITAQNNRAIAAIEGIRDRLRVLLVSGEPHPGERTWRNLLKADASVDLVHFTILRPPEKQDGTPINELSLIAFPTRELFVDKLNEFDLIIFDRYQRRGVLPLAYIANIADYVEKGGAVLVNAGPDYASTFSLYNTPLSAVLPAVPDGNVTVEPFRPQVTERGERHPVTRNLPGAGRVAENGAPAKDPTWGRWFRIVDAEVRNGETVMSGPGDKPLMVLSRSGQGRVALLLSDHAWLWTRGYEGGGPQAELLRRLAHWTMKEPELEEEALSGTQKGSDLVIERRTMEKQAAPVTLTAPSGKAQTVTLKEVEPGVFRGQAPVEEAGIYRLADGKLTAVAAAGSADPRETAAVVATDEALKPAVEATGGGIVWLKDGGSLAVPRIAMVKPDRAYAGSGWIGFKANGTYRVTAVERVPLYGSLLTLALLLGLVSLMWYREGR
ncbi:MAG: hypothetical protein U1E46_13165 [Hyphomicrobiales bacterium]